MIQLVWWVWLIGIIGSLLIGAFIVSVIFFIYSFFNNIKIKKAMANLPKSKKEISEYIKNPEVKKLMLDGGTPTNSDEKEVKEDERKKSGKFREFEKLRRIAQGKPGTYSADKGDDKLSKRSDIQERFDSSSSRNKDTIELD